MLPRLLACFVLLLTLSVPSSLSLAQDASEAEKERLIADRFLQVIMRRPRPGTALDRVYGYHIQAGTLDQLQADLQLRADKNDDQGASAMLLGLLQIQRGNDADAAKSLEQADRIRTDDAMASFYFGKALLLIGRTDAAALAFQRAIDRMPDRAEALPVFTELGRLYGRSQQHEKALQVWKQFEESFPGDARVAEQIARTLAEDGQDAAALERYEALATKTATSDDTRAVGYQIAAAEIKRRMGRSDEAIKDFERLLTRLRPASWLYADVRRRIEVGFLRTGDYAALADYYAKHVEQQSDDVELRLRHGQTLSKAGRLNEAEAALVTTTNLAPQNVNARLSLIDILKSAGKPADAAAQLEILVKQDADNPDYLVRLGNTWLDDTSLEKEARHAKAAEAWRRLADQRKADPVITAQVADLLRRIESNDDAIALYRRAIELAPDQPQYREYLGEFLHRLDRKDEALQTWALIAAGDRTNRDNLIRLAEVLNTFEYPAKALDAFAEAAKLDPTFAQRLRYAEFLSRASQYDESLAQLDQAETIAETMEEREQLFKSRIGVYSNSGTLEQRIVEATEKAKDSNEANDYRQLAVMLEAAARVADATEAIETAVKLQPSDITVLSVAAELYRKGARLGDAIPIYRSLAKLDSRFLSSYLKQIAELHMQLGQIDDAMATAAELIAAQPANPESYRVYAEQCFRLGRDDEGIEKLRRALQAAPRDRAARTALASALADRFRTEEAIELNWQLLADTDDLSEQTGIVSSLATLYERKGDFPRLVDRLELRGREASDMRSAILLTSAAHKATEDLGSARQSLEPLLAENPRDAELLQQMVLLSEAADDSEAALGYQQQLTALADTPENRNRFLMLLVDSGQLDAAEAALQRLQGADDPVTMIGLIDRAMKRGENDAAIRFCLAVLDRRSELWEVRIRLAAMLILTDKFDDALQQLEQVDALKLDPAAKSELAKDRESKRGPKTVDATQPWQQGRVGSEYDVYQLGSLFQLGPYASNNYGSSATTAISAKDYRHAQELAIAMRMVVSIKQSKLDEFIAAHVNQEELATTTDIEKLWNARSIATFKSTFADRNQSEAVTGAEAAGLLWRLAKLDVAERKSILANLMLNRLQLRYPNGFESTPEKPLEPLSDEQLDLALSAYEGNQLQTSNYMEFYFVSTLHLELLAAKRDEDAKRISVKYQQPPKTFAEVMSALMYFAFSNSPEGLAELAIDVRNRFPELTRTISTKELTEASQIFAMAMTIPKVSDETKLVLLDLGLAADTISNSKQNNRRSTLGAGTANVYYQSGTNYQSKQISVPFSKRLLSDSLVENLYQGLKFGEDSPLRKRWMEHLSEDVSLFPAGSELAASERKTRSVLNAFAHWWLDDLAAAAEGLETAGKLFPEDNDLWIERARLAAELKRPQAALDALDAINPVDQSTLQIRELAAMNLASKLGKVDRARIAAQRLFGMRLDNATELALADQLGRLGMKEMATAVLQRTRQRGGQDVSDLTAIANRYLSIGEQEAAAEVAYAALRKVNSGNDRNGTYYREQVVQILKSANRLDSLLTAAEQRVASAPRSMVLKMELAELYTAAGRTEDADKVFEQVAAEQPNDAKTLWKTAERLAGAGKNEEAVDKFLQAIEKDAEPLRQDFYKFQNAVNSAKASDKVYRALMDLAPKLESYVQGNLIGLYRSETREPTAAAKEFVDHLLKLSSVDALGNIFRSLHGHTELLKSPAMRSAVTRVFSQASVYESDSNFWQNNSHSSGGVVYGALEPCLDVVKSDDAYRTEVKTLIAAHTEGEKAKPLAKALLLVLDADDKGDPATISEQIRLLLNDKQNFLGYVFWWQVGQRFESTKGFENLAVDVLEHARDHTDDRRSGNQYEYSIAAKLADAYVTAKQKPKARAELLRGYAAIDADGQNQYNPGYGDYQALQTSQSIAQKLLKVDAKFDAIRIYMDALLKPERFAAAAQWGGSRSYQQSFDTGLKQACDSLVDADFAEFLTIPEAVETPGKLATRFDLMPISASPGAPLDYTSIATMVVSKLLSSDEGKAKLEEFDKQAAERLQTTPEDWSLAAMRALIAIALKHEDADAQITALTKQLPALTLDKESATIRTRQFLALYQPASLGIVSENPLISAAAIDLADVLVERAQQLESIDTARAISIAVLKARGHDDDPTRVLESLQAMLDAVVPMTAELTELKVQTTGTADECLKVAEQAAELGVWPMAMESLRRGFGGGPPLRVIASATGSGAFIASASRSSSNSGNEAEARNLAAISTRLVELFKRLEDETKDPLSAADTRLAYDTLVQIILPDSRADEVFPYLALLVQNNNRATGSTPDLKPANLSRMLALAAIKSGQGEEFAKLLASRRQNSQEAYLIDLLQYQSAVGKQDWPTAVSSLRQLATSMGISLDDAAATAAASGKSPSDVKTTANVLIHAILPVHSQPELTTDVIALESWLIQQASRDKAISESEITLSWMTKQMLNNEQVNAEQAQQWIDRYLVSVRLHYSNYSGSYAEDRVRFESTEMAKLALKAKRFQIAGKLLHESALRPESLNSSSGQMARFALQLVTIDEAERYQLLTMMTFGEKDDLAVESDLVMFVEPPSVFTNLADTTAAAKQIPLGAAEFPIVSSMMMLCDLAAKLGKTDELSARLVNQSKSPGDEAEAMIGLALLADGKVEHAGVILERVTQSLRDSKPTKHVETPLPIHAALLAARAASHDSLQPTAKQAWEHLLTHARHRGVGLAASFFNRMVTRLGVDKAVGAQLGSPLKHFVSYAMPYNSKPCIPMTEALYVLNDKTLTYVGGNEQNAFLFKYPLTGNFAFSHNNANHGWGESFSLYGGMSYQSLGYKQTATVNGLVGRQSVEVPNPAYNSKVDNLNGIDARGDQVAMLVNGQEVATHQRTESMPFAGLMFKNNAISSVYDIQITGQAVIPREVNLIEEQLRGWSCSIMNGILASPALPLAATDDAEKVKEARELARSEAKSRTTWYVHDNELLTGERAYESNPGAQRHIQYQRPLLDAELFTYQFQYEKDKQEVHPTVGRIVVLLRPDGVKLRWLPQAQSLESTDMEPLHEVAPDELIGDGKPELKENELNTVKLTAEPTQVVVEVNGQPVCRFTTSLDGRFGLLVEKDRSCRVVNAKLTGPWPTELPANLME